MNPIRLWRVFTRRRGDDAILQEEIEDHLQSLAREYREAGFSPEDAYSAARRRFGNLTKVHEDCRENFLFGAIETVFRDARYGIRGLRKTPMFVLVAALSLGLGIGVNLLVYSLFQTVFLGTPTAAKPDRLVRLRLDQNSHTAYPILAALQRADTALTITGYRDVQVNWRDGDRTIETFAQVVTPNFFDVVGGHASLGRLFGNQGVSVLKPARVVVISYQFWQRRLASATDVLSRTLTINGLPYSVTGVLPKGYRSIIGFNFVPDFYLPVTTELFPNLLDKRDSLDLAMIARLSEGQSREQARASLVAAASHIGAEFAPDNPRFGKAWEIQGIRDIDQVRSKQGNVLILFSILLVALVGLVIFIACANVAGLLLVRGVTRSREIAIRLAIGAGRWHIVRQLLTEGIVLAALGCVSGILIWRTAAIFFENVELPIPVPLVFQISTNSRMLLCAFALGAVCTVLSSLGPALQAAKSRFLPALKSEESNLGNRHLTLRNILVVSQISICFVLLISAILFFRTINRAKEVKTGFDVNHTITVRLREPKASFRVRDGLERLASIPGVRFASAADRIPLTFTSMATVVHLEGKLESAQFEVRQSNVTPGYFRTMGIPLLRGKDFRPSETGTVIVNQLFAERHFPDGNAIGHRIVYGVAPHTWTFEIKAIVANTKYFSLAEDPQEIIYLPLSDEQDTLYLFASMAAPANTTADSIRKKLRDWAPTALIEVHTLRDNLYVTLLPIQIGCTLLTIVGGIGLCLALVGFYSVLSYAVARKTKEIGIRIALGAPQSSVLQLVLSYSLSLLAWGIAVGAVASLGLAKPLQAILGTNSSYSLWAFSVSVVILLGVCFATALLPAYRAVHIDPLRAIQYE